MKWRIETVQQGVRLLFRPIKERDARFNTLHRMTDAEAIASDWLAIGNDMRGALTEYGRTAATRSKAAR